MELVGAYISALRSATGLSQPELALKVGVSERTVRNLESGKHEPKPSDLAQILDLIHGSWLHVAQLLRPDASIATVERLVRDIQDGRGFTEEQLAFLEKLTPDQRADLLSVARQMQK